MNAIENYVKSVAEHFKARLGTSLVEVYKLGSLAHGGFSEIYSDIDVGLLLSCAEPPAEILNCIAAAKALDPDYGKKLSVFWGNPEYLWGRLPLIDRLDLLDHGVPLLNNHRPLFKRPDQDDIRGALRDSLEKSWLPKLDELTYLTELEPKEPQTVHSRDSLSGPLYLYLGLPQSRFQRSGGAISSSRATPRFRSDADRFGHGLPAGEMHSGRGVCAGSESETTVRQRRELRIGKWATVDAIERGSLVIFVLAAWTD